MSMSVYEIVTERIIEKLQAGRIPWVKPWNNVKWEGPHNAETGRGYTGINRLLLDDGGYMTFKQIQKAGYTLRKGSKSQIVTYWKFFNQEDSDGNDTGKKSAMMRYYRVFSVNDIEGYVKKDKPHVKAEIEFIPVEVAHSIANRYILGDSITYREGGDAAFYVQGQHSITMPRKVHFKTIEGFYDVLFHEIGHSTAKGCARAMGSYAREEGVAELCSAYMMQHVGLSNEGLIENSAAYIDSWISQLRKDPKHIVSIASKAEKAMQYILEIAEKTEYGDIAPLEAVDVPDDEKAASPVRATAPVEIEPETGDDKGPDDDGPGGAPVPGTTETEASEASPEPGQSIPEAVSGYVSLAELKKALKQMKKVVPKKGSIETVENVRGEFYGGTLAITANNIDVQMTIRIPAEIYAPGVWYANYKQLEAAANSAISERCEIAATADHVSVDGMRIEAQKEIVLYFSNVADVAAVSLAPGELHKITSKLLPFVSKADYKKILTGVNMELGDTLTYTALSGYHLASYTAQADTQGACNVTIPAAALALLKGYKGAAHIITDNKKMVIEAGQHTIITRLLEGEFVKWRNIMPTDHATSATVDTKMLLALAKSAATNDGTGTITLHIGADGLRVETCRDELKSPLRELQADTSGPGIGIRFNARLMANTLAAVDAKRVRLNFNRDISPCYIEDGAARLLVLPIKFKN